MIIANLLTDITYKFGLAAKTGGLGFSRSSLERERERKKEREKKMSGVFKNRGKSWKTATFASFSCYIF